MGAQSSSVCPKRLVQLSVASKGADRLMAQAAVDLEEGPTASRTETGISFRVEWTPPAWSCQSTVQALEKLKDLPFDSQDPFQAFSGPGSRHARPTKGKLEGASEHSLPVLAEGHQNGFVNAAVTAFAHHYPISLSPDHFWILVLQAVSKHVEQNAEELRERFVPHEGKRTLTVDNTFTRGSGQNDWGGVVRDFSRQLDNMLMPGAAERLNGSFSTTGINEDIAAKVTVMEMCKSYVNFLSRTHCGIPTVSLEGTPEDWARLRSKAEELIRQQCRREFADWWLPSLLPVLDKVVDSANGNVDKYFWQSFVKRGSTQGSGAHTFISGWINCLFPFRGDGRQNPWCQAYDAKADWASYARGEHFPRPTGRVLGSMGVYGLDEESFPPGLSKAPVTWHYLNTMIQLTFVSGFFAASQHPSTWVVRPEVGWAIFEVTGASG
mmetsp:Transcript_92004/g.173370  ORF Transcript_92004/g.173370 Transcript_92004/m.173370 type:complete len:437 (-) Transcript_92004:281-1591(-)